jgi:hypothetical protein
MRILAEFINSNYNLLKFSGKLLPGCYTLFNKEKNKKFFCSLSIWSIAFVQMYRSLTMYWPSLHYIHSLFPMFCHTI